MDGNRGDATIMMLRCCFCMDGSLYDADADVCLAGWDSHSARSPGGSGAAGCLQSFVSPPYFYLN